MKELYQELIIDHGRRPRNFHAMDNATHIKDGFNPLCGDKLTLYLLEKNGVIEQTSFTGSGCAISMASASLMTENLMGKTIAQAEALFEQFHGMLTEHKAADKSLGKLMVLAGVAEYPMRVKCATLAWHTAMAALHNDPDNVSTE